MVQLTIFTLALAVASAGAVALRKVSTTVDAQITTHSPTSWETPCVADGGITECKTTFPKRYLHCGENGCSDNDYTSLPPSATPPPSSTFQARAPDTSTYLWSDTHWNDTYCPEHDCGNNAPLSASRNPQLSSLPTILPRDSWDDTYCPEGDCSNNAASPLFTTVTATASSSSASRSS